MSSKKNMKEGSKLGKFLKAPVKMMIKARDFYVRRVTVCSDTVVFTSAGGVPVGSIHSMPRSFSTNSSRSSGDDDFRELVRANSTKILGSKIDLEFQKRQQVSTHQSPKTDKLYNNNNKNMPRSSSAVIGRIDEDKPCDFQDVSLKMKPAVVYPRSKSYAVSRRPAGNGGSLIN